MRGGPVQQAGILGPEVREGSAVQSLPDTGRQLIVEVQVVEHRQPHGQHLLGNDQVAQVGPGEGPAGGAAARPVDGPGV